MEKKQFHRRGLGMLLLLAVILFGLGSSLYDAQMIHGAEYLARSQNSIAETQTVEAARGDILDRYGRVLVSNRVTYQVALNTDAMEKNRNDILLALIRIARDAGVEWEDTLPITAQPPFPPPRNCWKKCGRAFSWSWRARICAPWPEYCTSCTTAPW